MAVLFVHVTWFRLLGNAEKRSIYGNLKAKANVRMCISLLI